MNGLVDTWVGGYVDKWTSGYVGGWMKHGFCIETRAIALHVSCSHSP